MKRITYWVMSTITILVLLFSYRTSLHSDFASASGSSGRTVQTGSSANGVTPAGAGGGSGSGGGTGSGSGSAAASSSSATSKASSSTSASSAKSTKSGTYTGSSVDTRWGPVQVQITVANGKITAAQAVVYPNGNPRDVEINSQALPMLASEVVKAQSAKIDTISGATVTSDGYISSLQSAIDKANL